MTVYSAFTIPTLGMMAQSHSLATIGNNIANVTTGGFKRTDTNFSTVLSRTLDRQSDLGGVKPKDINQITQQGNLTLSNRDLDLAINGQGFFILKTDVSGGDTYFGRDGSFEMATVNDITVTGIGGISVTTRDGYLVDKNGYFVQGWTADPTTGLFSSTSLSSLRIDPFAFASVGQATTTAALELNLPSNDTPGLSQVDEITLSGTVEAADSYSVTVEGTTITYPVTGAEADLNAIRDALIAAINADATISAQATASASPSDNKILITAVTQGVTLAVSSSAVNGGAINDNDALSATVETAKTGDQQFFNIEVFDSNGIARGVRLDFTKTATNTWDMSTTIGATPVAQVDTVTLAGTIEAGDTYSIVVDGTTFSHTVLAADTLATISSALATSINASTSTNVTAAASGLDALTLTADTAGTIFTATSSTTNRTAVAQIDNVALAGVYAPGDTISVDIDGIGAVIYTVVANDLTANGDGTGGAVAGDSAAAFNNITTKLSAAIAADVPTAAVVTPVASGGGTGIVSFTAVSAGTAFTQVALATTVGTGGATASTPTPNVTSTADNTATYANTIANVPPTTTTTASVSSLVFNKDASLSTPATGSVTMSLSFPATGSAAAGTATVTMDVSRLTQFGGDFQPYSFTNNGFEAANAQTIKFDTSGNVIATFDDSTFRVVYKIPLAQFSNANALQESSGNVYQETAESGTALVVDVEKTGYASFLPNTHELSNVDLADEFTRMMMTQTAYNSSATVFKTVDEMITAARDLKR